jgi:hypothetical protein
MAKDCAAVNIYSSLIHCKGQTVLPGLRNELYGIPKSQIISWPELPALSDKDVDMAKIATLQGDFKLAADAKFIKISILDTASNVTSASQGDAPSKTFLNTATFKYPGINEEATGFCRMVNSDDFVFVYRQRDGKYRVIGNESFETNVNPTQETGSAVTDATGTTLEATVTDVCPAPFYVGKLPTDEGTLDCSTGELEAAA